MNSSILYAETNLVCVLILVLLALKIRKSMLLQQQRILLLYVMLSNAVFFVIDAVWIFFDYNKIGITIAANWALNITYYILSGVLGYYWFLFSETVQESVLAREKLYKRLALIPMLLLIVLTFVSIKTGWLFYIDNNNSYHRGPLYFLQLLTSYGYIIFTAEKAFILSFKTDDYRRKSDLKTLSTFVLPTLVAGALQVVFPGYPMLCVGTTVGVLYVYLTMQEQLVSLDSLTKLNNRNQLFQYLSAKLANKHDDKTLYLLMMDIDYFKSINDEYGHIEGDNALKKVAKCLMKTCKDKNYFIARFGGDEFVLLCELSDNENIDDVCKAVHESVKNADVPYKLTLSIGYAKYTSDIKNQQEFIERADVALYKVKNARIKK